MNIYSVIRCTDLSGRRQTGTVGFMESGHIERQADSLRDRPTDRHRNRQLRQI